MDILERIFGLFSWIGKQGRLVVVTGMLVGLAYFMVNSVVGLLPANNDSGINGLIWIIAGFCLLVIPGIIVAILVAETSQSEIEHGVDNQSEDEC